MQTLLVQRRDPPAVYCEKSWKLRSYRVLRGSIFFYFYLFRVEIWLWEILTENWSLKIKSIDLHTECSSLSLLYVSYLDILRQLSTSQVKTALYSFHIVKTKLVKVICNSSIATCRRTKNYPYSGAYNWNVKLWNEEFNSQRTEYYQSSFVDIKGKFCWVMVWNKSSLDWF